MRRILARSWRPSSSYGGMDEDAPGLNYGKGRAPAAHSAGLFATEALRFIRTPERTTYSAYTAWQAQDPSYWAARLRGGQSGSTRVRDLRGSRSADREPFVNARRLHRSFGNSPPSTTASSITRDTQQDCRRRLRWRTDLPWTVHNHEARALQAFPCRCQPGLCSSAPRNIRQ